MKKILIAALATVALASPSFALSPEAATFLKGIGLDPASATVRAADEEGTISTTFRGDSVSFSLESLAKDKKKNGALAFVATRAFIKLLARNPNTPFPKTNYDGMYLTKSERDMVADKIAAEA
ncbi:MAG: hypothetical protein ABL955_06070 [Elusimicrobiota bacterium]